MSESVIWEMQFVAVTVTLGVFLAVVYDVVRILRRVISHGTLWTAVEDILFWAGSGIIIFVVSFWENNGSVRWYTIAGVFFGAYLYHETFSPFIVKYMALLLNIPINILKKTLKKVIQSFRINTERDGEAANGKTKKKESV